MEIDLKQRPFGKHQKHGLMYKLYGLYYNTNIHSSDKLVFDYSNTLNVNEMYVFRTCHVNTLPKNIKALHVFIHNKDLIKHKYNYSNYKQIGKRQIIFNNLVRK